MHNIEKYELHLPCDYQPMSFRKRYEKRREKVIKRTKKKGRYKTKGIKD
jgi:hypothetical protein